jgi:hypothetical protein
MPLQNRQDAKGSFYRWGNSGYKYYYTIGNHRSREKAKEKAMKQARAIEAHKRWKNTYAF